MNRVVALVSMLVLSVFAAGCKSNCRVLSEKLCDCSLNSTEKNACLNSASTNEANFVPSATDEQTCAALLKSCDCRLIDTPQGKINCGLAWPTDSGI